jgi:hypothetical protein
VQRSAKNFRSLKEVSMNARHPLSRLCLSVLCLAAVSPVFALANRVFVSARSGNDANNCASILTPCQTFAGAVLQLNAGGEAIVLDSGGYGPVTITQSMTIEAPAGVVAFIHPPSGDAIVVSAGASDVVVLRGLVLNGGSGYGIIAKAVGTLHIENCVISGFAIDGIRGAATGSNLFIKDTISRQNFFGMSMFNGRASIDHCRMEGNVSVGIFVDGADVTVRDSVSAGNGGNGFDVEIGGAENSTLNLYQCLSTNNANDGFSTFVGGGATGFIFARVANSSISENLGHGLFNVGGATFESLGNNFVRGNSGGDVSGTITPVTGQ